MAIRNYRQAKRQKEEAKKARKLQKQQRRLDRTGPDDAPATGEAIQNGEPTEPAPLPEP